MYLRAKLNLSKWWQTIKISWSKETAYRLNFFMQITGPVIVFFFINYNIWSSIYGNDSTLIIKGHTFSQMINYHAWSMIVGMLAKGHMSFNLSEDIRLGRISSYLIYPFNFWEFHTAGFIAFQCLQLIISCISLTCLLLLNIIQVPSLNILFMGISYTFFVSIFWFGIQYLLGLVAFWLEETWILRVMFNIVTAFLSGAFFPLDLYPEWIANILKYTPFPYLIYYPIKTFSGEYNPFPNGFIIMSAWIIIIIMFNKLIWKKGIKHYTAAGM